MLCRVVSWHVCHFMQCDVMLSDIFRYNRTCHDGAIMRMTVHLEQGLDALLFDSAAEAVDHAEVDGWLN